MIPEENDDLEIKPASSDQNNLETPNSETNIQPEKPENTQNKEEGSFHLGNLKDGDGTESPQPVVNTEPSQEKSFKKYLLSIIIAVIFIVGIFFVYKFVFDTEDNSPESEESTEIDPEIPETPETSTNSEEMDELEEIVNELKEQFDDTETDDTETEEEEDKTETDNTEYIEDLEDSTSSDSSGPPEISIILPSKTTPSNEEVKIKR